MKSGTRVRKLTKNGKKFKKATVIQKPFEEDQVRTQTASSVRLTAGRGTNPLAPNKPITDGTERVFYM